MGGLLRLIADTLADFGQLVLWALMSAVNGIVAGVGAFIAFMLGLLPDLPPAPGPPTGGWLAWIAYIYPLGAQLALLAAFVACWIGFLAIRIPLKWIKAL